MAAADDLGPGAPAHRDRQNPQRPRLVYVTLPVRIAIAGLALQRRWWHSRCLHHGRGDVRALDWRAEGNLRPARPTGSLVATTGSSFPSGHAVATSVTAIAAVIALVPPGRWRIWGGAAAAAFSVLMGLSRAYLAAHWLSDAVAGLLLGASCALTAALVVGLLQRWWRGTRRRPTGAHRLAAFLRRTRWRGGGDRHEPGPDTARRCVTPR